MDLCVQKDLSTCMVDCNKEDKCKAFFTSYNEKCMQRKRSTGNNKFCKTN